MTLPTVESMLYSVLCVISTIRAIVTTFLEKYFFVMKQLGDTIFICWITLHQLNIFSDGQSEKIGMVKFFITYHNFVMLGNMCK